MKINRKGKGIKIDTLPFQVGMIHMPTIALHAPQHFDMILVKNHIVFTGCL